MNSRCSLTLETKDGALAKICIRLVTTQVLSPITELAKMWGQFSTRIKVTRELFIQMIGGGINVGFVF
uniref:Uncharacterized protein n=1 Tax=Marinobacter nauticus TaxID=2743 RepID=A0A455WFH0_MARNT|nr:hypothetical protein YBY_24310 [Marinobacter nauticus]